MSLPGDGNEVDINTLNIAPGEEGIARVISDLVPVTFPVKDAFPHNQKCLKLLLASLEVWWDSKEIFGMPKGGLGIDCPWLFVAVLPVALRAGSRSQASVIVLLKCIGVPVKFPVKHSFTLYKFTRINATWFCHLAHVPSTLQFENAEGATGSGLSSRSSPLRLPPDAYPLNVDEPARAMVQHSPTQTGA